MNNFAATASPSSARPFSDMRRDETFGDWLLESWTIKTIETFRQRCNESQKSFNCNQGKTWRVGGAKLVMQSSFMNMHALLRMRTSNRTFPSHSQSVTKRRALETARTRTHLPQPGAKSTLQPPTWTNLHSLKLIHIISHQHLQPWPTPTTFQLKR